MDPYTLLAYNVASTSREKVLNETRKTEPNLRRLLTSALTFDAVRDVLVQLTENVIDDSDEDPYRNPFGGHYREPFSDLHGTGGRGLGRERCHRLENGAGQSRHGQVLTTTKVTGQVPEHPSIFQEQFDLSLSNEAHIHGKPEIRSGSNNAAKNLQRLQQNPAKGVRRERTDLEPSHTTQRHTFGRSRPDSLTTMESWDFSDVEEDEPHVRFLDKNSEDEHQAASVTPTIERYETEASNEKETQLTSPILCHSTDIGGKTNQDHDSLTNELTSSAAAGKQSPTTRAVQHGQWNFQPGLAEIINSNHLSDSCALKLLESILEDTAREKKRCPSHWGRDFVLRTLAPVAKMLKLS